MNRSNIKREVYLTVIYLVIALLTVGYLYFFVHPTLHQLVQQVPFVKLKSFFHEYLNHPGGLAEYLAAFLVQSFHHNVFGSLVVAVFLLGQMFLLNGLIKSIFEIRGWFIPFGVTVISILLMNDYFLPFSILLNQFILFLFLWIYARLVHFRNNWFVFLLIYGALYFLSGPGIAMVFSLSALLILLYKSKKLPIFNLLFLIAITALIPFLAYRFIYNISLEDAYLFFFSERTINVRYHATNLTYIYIACVPILLVFFMVLGRMFMQLGTYSMVRNRIIQSSLLVIFAVVSFFILKSDLSNEKRDVVLCNYYNSIGEFEKTIDIVQKHGNEYNVALNIHNNRALLNKGLLTDNIFNYPQLIGSQALAPDLLGSPEFAMAASDLYYDLGLISQSQHGAYAILAINHNDVRALKRLVQTNVLLENYKGALPYLHSLSKRFYTKDFVQKYREIVDNPQKIQQYPELLKKKSLMPSNFAIPVSFSERMKDLVLENGQNKNAIDCMLIAYLMDHEVGAFKDNLKYHLNLEQELPTIYQEALLMNAYNQGQQNIGGYRIRVETRDRFVDFLQKVQKINNKDIESKKMEMFEFSNTYMYYTMFLSPKVTKSKVSKTY